MLLKKLMTIPKSSSRKYRVPSEMKASGVLASRRNHGVKGTNKARMTALRTEHMANSVLTRFFTRSKSPAP